MAGEAVTRGDSEWEAVVIHVRLNIAYSISDSYGWGIC